MIQKNTEKDIFYSVENQGDYRKYVGNLRGLNLLFSFIFVTLNSLTKNQELKDMNARRTPPPDENNEFGNPMKDLT